MTTVDVSLLRVEPARRGTVHLVGAGPGDPGLLTLRAAGYLKTCDLVAYDRLAPRSVLDLVPATAERICVGKRKGQPSWDQDEINWLLVSEARAGKAVVRLKGGDPFVFGRGGEEALACRDAGIPVEVVHGVTSAVAAPGAAGVPVTHRGLATAVAFVSGHEDPTKPESQLDWPALAAFPGTLVFLMGLTRIGRICGMLLANGKAASTPVAVVRWATTERQDVLHGDLVSIADEVAANGFGAPATIVVGDVAALADELGGMTAMTARTPRDAGIDASSAVRDDVGAGGTTAAVIQVGTS